MEKTEIEGKITEEEEKTPENNKTQENESNEKENVENSENVENAENSNSEKKEEETPEKEEKQPQPPKKPRYRKRISKRRKRIEAIIKKSMVLIMILFMIFFFNVVKPILEEALPSDMEYFEHAWQDNDKWEFKLFLSSKEQIDFSRSKTYQEIAHVTNLTYHMDYPFTQHIYDMQYTMKLKPDVFTNKTHRYIVFMASQEGCDYEMKQTKQKFCFPGYVAANAIKWVQDRPVVKKNLLTGKSSNNDTIDYDVSKLPYVPVYYPNLTFNLVWMDRPIKSVEPTPWNYLYLKVYPGINKVGPITTEDVFLNVPSRKVYLDPNSTEEIEFTISVSFNGFWLWSNKLGWDHEYLQSPLISEQYTEIKTTFTRNKYLVFTWLALAFAHLIFKVLAFKEDVSFWLESENLRFTSIQSVFFNIISEIIILLYLLDENTSLIILVPKIIGLILEFWKLTRLFEMTFEFPYFRLKEHVSDPITREFDKKGSQFIIRFIIPVFVVYTGFCFLTKDYKNLYSFIIQSAVQLVYAVGFLYMFPQVYMNYKLKTVAGISGTVLGYKVVNTFVDDLFSLVTNMPKLHLIACFRDDIVFFIWLYQRHIYKEDFSRANEFGEIIDEKNNERDYEYDYSDDEMDRRRHLELVRQMRIRQQRTKELYEQQKKKEEEEAKQKEELKKQQEANE